MNNILLIVLIFFAGFLAFKIIKKVFKIILIVIIIGLVGFLIYKNFVQGGQLPFDETLNLEQELLCQENF